MTQTLHTPSWSEPDQPETAMSPFKRFAALPEASGLYNPEQEKDACGLAIIATLRGEPGYDIVDAALTALRNLEHRGAVGADEGTGDGAGLLMQIPDEFFRAVTEFELHRPRPVRGRHRLPPRRTAGGRRRQGRDRGPRG
ncbi:hypothetical protein QFZ70_002034 [Arthrobacter sp. V1I9]|nr:hypothetical protein [Arthrobacter sp. V1I9]